MSTFLRCAVLFALAFTSACSSLDVPRPAPAAMIVKPPRPPSAAEDGEAPTAGITPLAREQDDELRRQGL